jgi:hypothetical protein
VAESSKQGDLNSTISSQPERGSAKERMTRAEITRESLLKSLESPPLSSVPLAASSSDETLKFRKRAYELYGVTNDLDYNTTTLLNGVHSGSPQYSNETQRLNPLHIEPLLDQCQELVNRALQDRRLYEELASKAFQTKLELQEFERLNRIHSDEIATGAYTVPYKKAYYDRVADDNANKSTTTASNVVTGTYNRILQSFNRLVNLRGFSTWVGAAPFLARDNSAKLHPATQYQIPGPGWPPQADKLSLLQQFAMEQAQVDLDNQLDALDSQANQLASGSSAALARSQGGKIYEDWLEANVGFQTRRLAVSVGLNDEKVAAVSMPGGALNYVEQMNRARVRYNSNLAKAYQRMVAINKGLTIVYGYREGIPRIAVDDGRFVDECWNWVQNAINWIAISNRNDQNFIFQFSLRKKLGHGEFRKGVNEGKWTMEVNPGDIPNCAHLRLRGLSVSCLTNHTNTWRIELSPPRDSYYVHTDGEIQNWTCESDTKIKFGRVMKWDPLRPTDIFGVVSSHNRSPFGNWTISSLKPNWVNAGGENIEDLLLDMHFAAK